VQNNPEGVVSVRFSVPADAKKCVEMMNGRYFDQRQLEAFFWDGKTDYKVKETKEDMQRRLDEFGKWLEEQSDEDTPAAQ